MFVIVLFSKDNINLLLDLIKERVPNLHSTVEQLLHEQTQRFLGAEITGKATAVIFTLTFSFCNPSKLPAKGQTKRHIKTLEWSHFCHVGLFCSVYHQLFCSKLSFKGSPPESVAKSKSPQQQ
jgi:hypothetical protein